MLIFDVIIIILQLINLYFILKLYKLLKSKDKFFEFVRDKFWSMTVDIGRLRNKVKEIENELSI